MLRERARELPASLSPANDVAASALLDARWLNILSRIASRSATLPGRDADCAHLGGGRRCGDGVTDGRRSFAQPSIHSSTAVSLTIQRPPISEACSSPSLIARLTVRCSHRVSSATSWTVRYGLVTSACYRLRRAVLPRLVERQNGQMCKGPINVARSPDGKGRAQAEVSDPPTRGPACAPA